MDTSLFGRFLKGVLTKLSGPAADHGPSVHIAAEELPEQEDVSQGIDGWPAPDGSVMQARWKGHNATVWWPLKEGEEIAGLRELGAEAIFCETETAVYEFFTPAVLDFIRPEDIEQAWRMRDLGKRLRVRVSGYQIMSADLIPREQARAEKDIA